MENDIMCTKLEVKEVVHDELKEAVPALVGEVISQRVGRFLYTFWAVIIGLVLSSSGAWFSLYYQVQRHNDVFSEENQYTKEDHEEYAKSEREYVDQRISTIERSVDVQNKSLELSISRLETAVARLENVIIRNQ